LTTSPRLPQAGLFYPFASLGALLFLSKKGMITDNITGQQFIIQLLMVRGWTVGFCKAESPTPFGVGLSALTDSHIDSYLLTSNDYRFT
jgi:hypothetical protein